MLYSQSRKSIQSTFLVALFNFVFLCTEYLFDDRMAAVTDPSGVVTAQNIVLGFSVVGFLLFTLIDNTLNTKWSEHRRFVALLIYICVSAALLVMVSCTHYLIILCSGIVCFVVFGVLGSAVFYNLSVDVHREHLARKVGIAYALSIFIQYITNNLVRSISAQAAIIAFALVFLTAGTLGMGSPTVDSSDTVHVPMESNTRTLSAFTLTICIVFTTCIFSTLDNAVTLVHASGTFDIGQWPRLILAVSGLTAGFLFDWNHRQFMSLFMYIVTLLSTICVVVIRMGGPFLLGLLVFYISAGFFVVYFSTSFMDLSRFMPQPKLWAGFGRAVNNLTAFGVSALSVKLLETENSIAILVTAVVLFAFINISILFYLSMYRVWEQPKESNLPSIEAPIAEVPSSSTENIPEETALSKLDLFFGTYGFTLREQEVFSVLISSDESVQDIAKKLAISRAALYRHISSMNEKTQTQNRIGLIRFYFDWNGEK